jgi:hypothetical protein
MRPQWAGPSAWEQSLVISSMLSGSALAPTARTKAITAIADEPRAANPAYRGNATGSFSR